MGGRYPASSKSLLDIMEDHSLTRIVGSLGMGNYCLSCALLVIRPLCFGTKSIAGICDWMLLESWEIFC